MLRIWKQNHQQFAMPIGINYSLYYGIQGNYYFHAKMITNLWTAMFFPLLLQTVSRNWKMGKNSIRLQSAYLDWKERKVEWKNLPHRVIDTPHENAEERLICTEKFNLLVLNAKMFLFELTQSARQRRTRHYCCFLTIDQQFAIHFSTDNFTCLLPHFTRVSLRKRKMSRMRRHTNWRVRNISKKFARLSTLIQPQFVNDWEPFKNGDDQPSEVSPRAQQCQYNLWNWWHWFGGFFKYHIITIHFYLKNIILLNGILFFISWKVLILFDFELI